MADDGGIQFNVSSDLPPSSMTLAVNQLAIGCSGDWAFAQALFPYHSLPILATVLAPSHLRLSSHRRLGL